MTAFSGKKYPIYKVRDLPPDDLRQETTETGLSSMRNPRSVGTKYLPVRISTAFFDGSSASKNPNSSRKTMGLASRQPIRNIHKLFESPKRNARKRLDNLYDCSKPKENTNSTTIKAQALSTKKLAPKTPVNNVTSDKEPNRKTGLTKNSPKSRPSRLLPPGTITGSYLNGRSSLAPGTSIYKPTNNQLTLAEKNSRTTRPSDVVEESPQPLESSYDSSEETKKQPLLSSTGKKSVEVSKRIASSGAMKIQKETSPLRNIQDEKERQTYCCKCSKIINDSKLPEDIGELPDPSIKTLVNSIEIADQDLIYDKNKAEGDFQRPTVIVMQKESTLQVAPKNLNESAQIPVQDGSYSEILSLQPSANSSEVDESLLFKHTENACTRSEITTELNGGHKPTEINSELMSMNNETLLEQKRFLTDSISQHEKSLTSMKLMLENINSRLNKLKTLESNMRLSGLTNLNSEDSSLLVESNFKTTVTGLGSSENCETSFVEDLESHREANRPEGSKQRKNQKSFNIESRTEEQENNPPKDVSTESKRNNNKIENIENKPPQRRRSARLALKNNDLSLSVEQNTPAAGKRKTEITQAKSKPCTPSMTTPARSAKWGRRSERPLREYMVLKSAMKFLNTPDSRRYRIGSDEKVQIRDSLDKTDQALLSDKLLKELHDLYATP